MSEDAATGVLMLAVVFGIGLGLVTQSWGWGLLGFVGFIAAVVVWWNS